MRTGIKIAQRAGRALAVAALALGAQLTQAYSVSLAPSSQTVFQGETVQVNVTVADVRELMPGGLGSFDFTISFDGGILEFDSVLDGGVLGLSFLGLIPGTNTLDVSDISFTDPAELLAQQVDLLDLLRASGNPSPSLTLFALNFRTIGLGSSALNFERGTLSDVEGTELPFTMAGGSVTVLENLTVPVPGTLGLVLAAALAGVVTRRGRALSAG